MGAGVCSERFMKACGPVPRAAFPLMEESQRFPKQEDPRSVPLGPFLPLRPIPFTAEAWAEIGR